MIERLIIDTYKYIDEELEYVYNTLYYALNSSSVTGNRSDMHKIEDGLAALSELVDMVKKKVDNATKGEI